MSNDLYQFNIIRNFKAKSFKCTIKYKPSNEKHVGSKYKDKIIEYNRTINYIKDIK